MARSTREKALPEETSRCSTIAITWTNRCPAVCGVHVSTSSSPIRPQAPPGISVDEDALINLKLGEGRWLKLDEFRSHPTHSRSRTVNDIFRDNLPISFQLGVMALTLSVIVGDAARDRGGVEAEHDLGLHCHEHRHLRCLGAGDRAGADAGGIFAVALGWFPPTGWGAQPPYVLFLFPKSITPEYFTPSWLSR